MKVFYFVNFIIKSEIYFPRNLVPPDFQQRETAESIWYFEKGIYLPAIYTEFCM